MKKLIAILFRDRIDFFMFCLVIAATVQHFIVGKNLTPAFGVLVLYIFGAMYRMYVYNMTIRKQDQDIKLLNKERFRLMNEVSILLNPGTEEYYQLKLSKKVEEDLEKEAMKGDATEPKLKGLFDETEDSGD